jgi:chromatin assembly factor 1 subunit A
MFDYTYDSGDDWEEEEGGEDVDDFGEVKPEEEEEIDSDQEEEDEFDDWLDDTEDGYAPIPIEDDNDPLAHAGPSSRQERLQVNPVKKSEKPRKVVKIVPSWKGPIWEAEVGKNDEFAEYRIQLLNGKLAPIQH